MLVVLERGREEVAFEIFRRYGLEVANVGRVTDDGRLRLLFKGEVVADMPVAALVDEAPVYSARLHHGVRWWPIRFRPTSRSQRRG